jgi:spore germination cell wall hydrolase CwlJ-like protein
MLAVAAVTLERQQSPDYPNTIAKVVWEKRRVKGKYYPQFSWTRDGKRDAPTIYGKKTWEKALRLARMFSVPAVIKDEICPEIATTERMWDMLETRGLVVKRHEVACEAYNTIMKSKIALLEELSPVNDAIYYHATYVNPYWSGRLIKAGWQTVQVGDHIFYHKEENNR